MTDVHVMVTAGMVVMVMVMLCTIVSVVGKCL